MPSREEGVAVPTPKKTAGRAGRPLSEGGGIQVGRVSAGADTPPPPFPPPRRPASPTSGHRLLPHTADAIIEAWGPDRVTCVTEALLGLVESFARVSPDAPTRLVPLDAPGGKPADVLVSLLEGVIYRLDVDAMVPVRFHLADSQDGGVSGQMEVVGSERVEVVGPVPKAVSYHDLSIQPTAGGWRCHVLIDV